MKRATLHQVIFQKKGGISIHALVKRATAPFLTFSPTFTHFNPRPREEGDVTFIIAIVFAVPISIHALVKRATKDFTPPPSGGNISIHALVKRATPCC